MGLNMDNFTNFTQIVAGRRPIPPGPMAGFPRETPGIPADPALLVGFPGEAQNDNHSRTRMQMRREVD